MKIYVYPGVKRPERKDDQELTWNLFPRAIVGPDYSGQPQSLYPTRIDLTKGNSYLIPPHKTVAIGLGVMFDFGETRWYCGLISMRLKGLFLGLEVVNANNPIRSGATREVVAFVRNNHPKDSIEIEHGESLLQIHFQQILQPDVVISNWPS